MYSDTVPHVLGLGPVYLRTQARMDPNCLFRVNGIWYLLRDSKFLSSSPSERQASVSTMVH